MNIDFELNILRQHWIKDDDKDDKQDLCSHGEIFIRIADEIISDKKSGSWCLTASGLFLLRTLSKNHKIGDLENFLIPCCGHFIIPNEKEKCISILGCNKGLDWNIEHIDNNVKLSTEKGTTIKISFLQYKSIILKFIREIEEFYGNPNEKQVPNEKFDIEMFEEFWREWNELKISHNFK